MSPIWLKVMIMAVLVMVSLILIILFYLIYKNIFRPMILRVFKSKKILKASSIILRSKDEEEKVSSLVKEGITDADIVRIAEIEIVRAKNYKPKENKGWRFWKNGKKESVQQVSGGTSQGSSGATGTGTERAGEVGGNQTSTATPSNDSGHERSGPIQSESVETPRRANKYFS